tara:strand:- start:3039 stop:4601 length:1563 start_codon:yes stop_codon:yes gene_type:complete
VYAFESFMPEETSYAEIYRDTDNAVPLVIEISSTVLSFYKSKGKFKKIIENKQAYYLVPFIPVYFIKSINFKNNEDMKNFIDIKFSNIDKGMLSDKSNLSYINTKVSEKFFNDGSPSIFQSEESGAIPASQVNTIDSLLGAIQVLIYVAKKETASDKTKIYIQLIEDIVNGNNDNELIYKIFGFDVLGSINKGISSIAVGDSLDAKIFKSSLSKLVSEAFQDITFGVDLIEDIIDVIPGSLLSDTDNEEVSQFLDYINAINAGIKSLPEDIFKPTKSQSIIRTSLILLMTQVGKRELFDIIDLFEENKIDEEIFICSSFLYGLYRNYSGLDNVFKRASHLKNVSLLASPLLSEYTSNTKIEKTFEMSPNHSSKWWELRIFDETLTSIEIDDSFYTSIIAQAAEAGFKFIDEGEEKYIYNPPFKADNPSLYMIKGNDNFFRIKTEPLLKNSLMTKLTKNKIISLLSAVNVVDFRSSLSIQEDGCLILKQDQLSSTLDILEIETMIKNLISDFKLLKKILKQ